MRHLAAVLLVLPLSATACVDLDLQPLDFGGAPAGAPDPLVDPSPTPAGDDPIALWGGRARVLPIAVGGIGRVAIRRGEGADGPLSVKPNVDSGPAVDIIVKRDTVITVGATPGVSSFIATIGPYFGLFSVSAVDVVTALPRPATRLQRLFRPDWSDAGEGATFAAARDLPVTIGLAQAGGDRALDLAVEVVDGPAGARWDRMRDDTFTFTGLPVGRSIVHVTSGGVDLVMPIDVVAAAETLAITVPPGACFGEYLVCGTAAAGGREVIAYDWAMTAEAPATNRAFPAYSNCTIVKFPEDAAAVTLDVFGANRFEKLVLARPTC